jgi:hypothetical protein
VSLLPSAASALKLVPAVDVGKLYIISMFSAKSPISKTRPSTWRIFPLLASARIYDVTLSPGEIIFIPLAWWHQVKWLDFSHHDHPHEFPATQRQLQDLSPRMTAATRRGPLESITR